VRLACVINGIPIDPDSYLRADRVGALETEVHCGDETTVRTTQLAGATADRVLDRQSIHVRCRELDELGLVIRSTYRGQWITEPKNGHRVRPTSNVPLAELTLYEDDPEFHPGAAHWPQHFVDWLGGWVFGQPAG